MVQAKVAQAWGIQLGCGVSRQRFERALELKGRRAAGDQDH